MSLLAHAIFTYPAIVFSKVLLEMEVFGCIGLSLLFVAEHGITGPTHIPQSAERGRREEMRFHIITAFGGDARIPGCSFSGSRRFLYSLETTQFPS